MVYALLFIDCRCWLLIIAWLIIDCWLILAYYLLIANYWLVFMVCWLLSMDSWILIIDSLVTVHWLLIIVYCLLIIACLLLIVDYLTIDGWSSYEYIRLIPQAAFGWRGPGGVGKGPLNRSSDSSFLRGAYLMRRCAQDDTYPHKRQVK